MSRSHMAWLGACGLLCLWLATPVYPCSVCFGDADSPMGRGAAAGVWTLAGVAAFVLLGIGGMGLFWVHRSRRVGDFVEPGEE